MGIFIETALTGLAVGALTVEAADAVDAGSAVEACSSCTIVDVDAAVGSGPSVHAYARITARRIGARGAVVAQGWPDRALVHVELALCARVRWRAETGVFVYPVHAGRTVLTQIPWTVVDVLLALLATETWNESDDKLDFVLRAFW